MEGRVREVRVYADDPRVVFVFDGIFWTAVSGRPGRGSARGGAPPRRHWRSRGAAGARARRSTSRAWPATSPSPWPGYGGRQLWNGGAALSRSAFQNPAGRGLGQENSSQGQVPLRRKPLLQAPTRRGLGQGPSAQGLHPLGRNPLRQTPDAGPCCRAPEKAPGLTAIPPVRAPAAPGDISCTCTESRGTKSRWCPSARSTRRAGHSLRAGTQCQRARQDVS